MSSVVASLQPAIGLDWSVRAGELEWDCWHTAEHIGDCLMSFAGQLVARPEKRFVCFMANADKDASPEQVLEFAEAGGRILAATVRASGPEVRAYHPTGQADPEGFAALGCVEMLLHGADIAQGLGLAIDPPREVCARVLARLAPETAQELSTVDPWAALRWSTGRIELPGRPRLREWHLRSAPLGE
ncbi:hypothetical protein [Micromonospora sp. NPDC047074]|uniref:hypothetical protein n=1 Tax=Micromonospora sp. NPDC047074 TaxID=3154339 RepID=UPI0033EB003A